jgi:hypothetical protein
LKILEDNGFTQYSGNNLWVKYYPKRDNKKVPVLFATSKKNGQIIITNYNGDVMVSSTDEKDIKDFLLSEIRDFKIDELLD